MSTLAPDCNEPRGLPAGAGLGTRDTSQWRTGMVPGVAKVFVLAAIVLSTVISIATAQVPLMLRGTIESASNRTLAVKARDGMATKVMLADDAHVFLLKQASLA